VNIHESGPVWDAFLRDICEHPDDLTPRLVLADWLEEQGHPTQRARAECIRLMVEGSVVGLKKAWAILEQCFPQWWLPTWAPLSLYRKQRGNRPVPYRTFHVELPRSGGLNVCLHGARGLSVTLRNGFVEGLLVPLAVLEEYVGRLFSTCPLKRVVLIDRHPSNRDRDGWCWFNANVGWPDGDETASLPSHLFHLLALPRAAGVAKGWHLYAPMYADEAEARDALSTAILAWGRELQGVPPLPGTS